MNYRSIADLANCIRENLFKIPRNIELIVGVPRSGMLAANIIALNLNLKLTDLSGFINDMPLSHGQTRQTWFPDLVKPSDAGYVLVVDDSIDTGGSIQLAKELIERTGRNQIVLYCAIYATNHSANILDIYFDLLPQPRIFEWNVMHRGLLSVCCVDIDGILCVDPTSEENDDGIAYRNFLTHARPLVVPCHPIGHLVTSRLEKYRNETESWLKQHQVAYEQLHMLDLPDAESRRRLGCHASYKAEIYRKLWDTKLFIESEPLQAMEISKASGKPVLSFTTQQLFEPNFSFIFIENKVDTFRNRVTRKIKSVAKSLIREP